MCLRHSYLWRCYLPPCVCHVRFSWLYEKYSCLSKCNCIGKICRATRPQFLTGGFCWAGNKRPGDSAENQDSICILKLITTGLLSKVASNISCFLLITSGSMRNGLCRVLSKMIHFLFLLFLNSFSPFLFFKMLEYVIYICCCCCKIAGSNITCI